MSQTEDPQLAVSKRKRLPPEAERLWHLGWAIHWLKPKSKVPVESKWTEGPRLTLEGLRARYKPGMGIGVRLGGASKLGDYFLAVIDVDIKSSDPRHKDEAYTALFKLFPEIKKTPYLLSGRGNGSAHYYIKVKVPVRGNEVKARSTEKCQVNIDGELKSRPAWEIAILSEGRQAALVGTIHPDTGKEYTWGFGVLSNKEIPLINAAKKRDAKFPAQDLSTSTKPKPANKPRLKINVNAKASKLGLRREQVQAIRHGDNVGDRSAEIFGLCMALLQRRTPEADILGVFTNPDYYLGQAAYEHAGKTKDRSRAAQWVEKYCLAKAREKVNETAFDIEELDELENPKAKGLNVRADVAHDTRIGNGGPLPRGFEGIGGWEDQLELKWVKDKTGDWISFVKSTISNFLLIIENKAGRLDILHHDAFADKRHYQCDTPWGIKKGEERSSGTDDALRLKDWLRDVYGIEPPLSIIEETLDMIALRYQFHPVKQYLESLEWDGVPRVENAFRNYLNALSMPEPYLSTVSRQFFQAMVQRIYEPGAKFDTVVVLEGKQGLGKSSFGEILAGKSWFLDGLPPMHDKDAATNLVGIWLCELSELASLYKSAIETVKAYVTRTCDRVRPSYGKRRVDKPRTTVFLGTTNAADYLTDTTGNRRWLPVKIKGLDFQALERDRDQLWAEAYFNYLFDRQKLWLTGKAKAQAEALQETRRLEDEGDIMHSQFGKWIIEQKKAGADISRVTLHQVFEGAFLNFSFTRGNMIRAGEVLRNSGYQKRHSKKGNIWVRDR